MNEDLNTALSLMGIGMITVFVVLSCVVLLGNLLIRFVNRFVPAPVIKTSPNRSSDQIAPSKIAAITAAVDIFTKGKGQVSSIKKLN